MRKRTFRPHELAAITQKAITSVALILMIIVFISNGKKSNIGQDIKTAYAKMFAF